MIIVRYTLTAKGKTPEYIINGGYFPKKNNKQSPQDWDLIGATVDGSDETGLGALANKAAIKSYLDTYTSEWTQDDGSGGTEAFDQDAAATGLWAKKA